MTTKANKGDWAKRGRQTHPAGWSEGAVDIEKTYCVLDGTGLERGVDACSFGHLDRSRTSGITEEVMMILGGNRSYREQSMGRNLSFNVWRKSSSPNRKEVV